MTDSAYTITQKRQWTASDPKASAWVAANAGAGKTYVLTQRVIRLLLAGSEPATILCLTFTKAAAAQMSRRIFDRLARWTTLNSADLAGEILELTGVDPGPSELANARRLFAKALETPGGLKIQTIHAFCERLLHQFPLEANVPGHFSVLEESRSRAMLKDAQQTVLDKARRRDTPLGGAVWRLAQSATDFELDAVLDEAIAKRDLLRLWLVGSGFEQEYAPVADAIADLRVRFGLTHDDSLSKVQEEICSGFWDADFCRSIVDQISVNENQNDRRAAAGLHAIVAARAGSTSAGEVEARTGFFLVSGDEGMKARTVKTRFSAATRKTNPELDDVFEAEASRLLALIDRLAKLKAVDATHDLLLVTDAILAAYKSAKARTCVLDFNDLIARTRALLMRADAAAWVLYKLDAGLNHVLIDEAQDTSPSQWDIVEALTDDFFSGEGAVAGSRSVFAVGDDKQSIFGFQGADPDLLSEFGERFSFKADAVGLPFVKAPLAVSFRSTKEILDAVNAVFSGELSSRVTRQAYEDHSARRSREPGFVRIWPRLVRQKNIEPDDWTTPVDAARPAEADLAERIAREIRDLLQSGAALPSGKRVTPGEILILSAKRGTFATAMDRALKAYNLPTAGSDRVALASHIAVLDLLAIADFALLPEDDLNLAAVLKCPILSLDDDDLLELAPRRGAKSLWSELGESAEPNHKAAWQKLAGWRDQADRLAPFEFFSNLLSAGGGRAAFRARLGQQVDDVLDAFLSQLLALERNGNQTLQQVVGAMRESKDDIKRDVDEGSTAIRIMTVHGAKGLEADVVFLADTGTAILPHQHRDQLIEFPIEDGSSPSALFWRRPKDLAPSPQRNFDEREARKHHDEYYRLLYVAMTRARDVLYVTGIRSQRGQPGSWYDVIDDALVPAGAERDEDTGELLEIVQWPEIARDSLPAAPEDSAWTNDPVTIPDWARMLAPPLRLRQRPVQPSKSPTTSDVDDLVALEPDNSAAAAIREDAMMRGQAIHGLLEILADLPPNKRADAAEQFLQIRYPVFASETSLGPRLIDETLATLGDRRLEGLFKPGSRAEVPLVGSVEVAGNHIAVSGQIDRMMVSDDLIWIADFKTDGKVPAQAETVPATYLRQLALYRALVTELFPGRKIRSSLVWTAGISLMDFDEAILRSHLDQAA